MDLYHHGSRSAWNRVDMDYEVGEMKPNDWNASVSLSKAPSFKNNSCSDQKIEEDCCDFEGEYDEYELEENMDYITDSAYEWFMNKFADGKLKFEGSSWSSDKVERLCVVCKTQYFKGYVALIRHAETFGKKLIPTHRGYAKALTETLNSISNLTTAPKRDITVIKRPKDDKIIWPPVVIVENTRNRYNNKLWEGLGNEEVKQEFLSLGYEYIDKAKNLYDKNGHAGISFLQFDASEIGFYEAEKLNFDFEKNGIGRMDWIRKRSRSHAIHEEGELILFAYLATIDDMRRLDPTKKMVKWTEVSKEENVDKPLKKMKENKREDEMTILKEKYEKQKLMKQLNDHKEEMNKMHEMQANLNKQLRMRDETVRRYREEMMKNDENFQNEISQLQRMNEYKIRKYQNELQTQNEIMEKERAKFELMLMKKDEIINFEVQQKFSRMTVKYKTEHENLSKEYEEKVADLDRRNAQERKELEEELARQQSQLEIERMEYAERVKKLEEALTEFKKMQAKEDVGNECAVCFFPFLEYNELPSDDKMDYNYRALLMDCRHAKICFPCSMLIFQNPLKKKRECPICKSGITKKPVQLNMFT